MQGHCAAGGIVVPAQDYAVRHGRSLTVDEGLIAMRPGAIVHDMTIRRAAAGAATPIAHQRFSNHWLRDVSERSGAAASRTSTNDAAPTLIGSGGPFLAGHSRTARAWSRQAPFHIVLSFAGPVSRRAAACIALSQRRDTAPLGDRRLVQCRFDMGRGSKLLPVSFRASNRCARTCSCHF